MNLDDILKEWAIDSKIEKDTLEDEFTKIDQLHFKYYKIFLTEKKMYQKLISEQKKYEVILEEYFTGTIDGKDIGREPFQKELTKSGVQKYIDADEKNVKFKLAISNSEEKLVFLKDIIRRIHARNFTINGLKDWMKFINGG